MVQVDYKWGRELTPLLQDESITSICILNYKEAFIEKDNQLIKSPLEFDSEEAVNDLAHYILTNNSFSDTSKTSFAFRAKEGWRIKIVLQPESAHTTITIVKHDYTCRTLDDLVSLGTLTDFESYYLKRAVEQNKNILISSERGIGKTTLLNALTLHIPKNDSLLILDKEHEIEVNQDTHSISLTDLHTLQAEEVAAMMYFFLSQQKTSRLVYNEIRDQNALELLYGMLTVSKSIMTSIQASNVSEALDNYFLLASKHNMYTQSDLQLRPIMGENIDVIVQLSSLEGKRYISDITEVIGYDEQTNDYQLKKAFRRNQ